MTTDNPDRHDPGDPKQPLPDEAAALSEQAIAALRKMHDRNLTIATAESCTGGLLAALLTDQDGLGHCFDRGFVTYTDEAKGEMLGIDPVEIRRHGAVSAEIAKAMALGALQHSNASIAIAATGFAGPAGPRDEVGLVHLACIAGDGFTIARTCRFGPLPREKVRNLAARAGLEMIADIVERSSQGTCS